MEAIKNRVTYPRTGYVSYRKPPTRPRTPPAWLGVVIAALLVSVVAGAALGLVTKMLKNAGLPDWMFSMPMTQGVILALVFALMGHRYGLLRFVGLAVVSLVIGVLAALGDMTFGGSALFFLVMGGGLVFSGAIVLTFYLRQTVQLVEDQ